MVYVNQLYDFLHDNQVQRRLVEMAAAFKDAGDLVRAKEYEQIYRLVMELLEQIHGLLGEEEITRQEFYDILEAGFGEIQVGTLPQNVDRILVGDMERTRLKQIKVLFFLGVNDGNIPKSVSKGGIISDMDREFLKDSKLELAPTPRQQMFIQRLYLYLNLTKPSWQLYLSYARMGNDGKSIRPAYLVGTLKRLFPNLEINHPAQASVLSQVVTPREGMRYLAQGLRDYVEGAVDSLGDPTNGEDNGRAFSLCMRPMWDRKSSGRGWNCCAGRLFCTIRRAACPGRWLEPSTACSWKTVSAAWRPMRPAPIGIFCSTA